MTSFADQVKAIGELYFNAAAGGYLAADPRRHPKHSVRKPASKHIPIIRTYRHRRSRGMFRIRLAHVAYPSFASVVLPLIYRQHVKNSVKLSRICGAICFW
jgi:hypothetical protein